MNRISTLQINIIKSMNLTHLQRIRSYLLNVLVNITIEQTLELFMLGEMVFGKLINCVVDVL